MTVSFSFFLFFFFCFSLGSNTAVTFKLVPLTQKIFVGKNCFALFHFENSEYF